MIKGEIYSLEAYSQGKLLDNSGWFGYLPRSITPSDMDLVIANNERILFVELKPNVSTFAQLDEGQRRLYCDIVRAGRGKLFAAVAQYNPPIPPAHIDTTDIIAFQLCAWRDGKIDFWQPQPGKIFMPFVKKLIFS